jgi:hypothetical protein
MRTVRLCFSAFNVFLFTRPRQAPIKLGASQLKISPKGKKADKEREVEYTGGKSDKGVESHLHLFYYPMTFLPIELGVKILSY